MSLISRLALELNKSETDVLRFLISAPKKYKVYTIPKRTSGHRVIAQPSKELKIYQRKFLEMQQFPIHDAAVAYRKGLSIKDNANLHKNNRYLLKIDLENFFNSISSSLFWQVWEKTLPLPNHNDKVVLTNLLFWSPSKKSDGQLVLSVGAPTSPMMSNFFMYPFDCLISAICKEKNIVYTRYADDLTFSTKNKGVLFDIPNVVQKNLSLLFSNAIRINRKKTKFSSMAHNRHITGITINNGGCLSLGRDRKRYIKHIVHQFSNGQLEEDKILNLKGILSFARHIEPSFIESLEKKYSKEIIEAAINGNGVISNEKN